MVESGQVLGKGTIRSSIVKLFERVPKKGRICLNTENMKNPGVYLEKIEFVRVPGKGRIPASIEKLSQRLPEKGSNLCEYRKMVESERVPGKGRIRVRIEKLSRRVSENGRICVNTEKWWNPGEYWKRVESV